MRDRRGMAATVRLATAAVLAAILVTLFVASRDGSRPVSPAAVVGGRPETIATFFGWTESRASIEELVIQACMVERGFPYAVEPDTGPEPLGSGMNPDEYAEEHGYGIVAPPQGKGGTRTDPNYATFNALPPAEQQRYLEALQGDSSDGDAADGSCAREASRLVNLDHQLLADAFGPELQAMDRGVTDRLRDDGELEAWRACMRAQGFDGAVSPEQFVSETGAGIRKELDAAGGEPEARRRVLEHELAVAAEERSCTRPLEARTNELRHQHEGRFVRRHRAELEDIRRRYAEELARFLE